MLSAKAENTSRLRPLGEKNMTKIRGKILGVLSVGSIGMSGATYAALSSVDGGLAVYDSTQNITWVADANLASSSGYCSVAGRCLDNSGLMTWPQAMNWIASLNAGAYLGITNWRLPNTAQPDPNCNIQFDLDLNPGGLGAGTGCTLSEMGHLYYVDGISTTLPGLFYYSLQSGYYWSGTNSPNIHETGNAWVFNFSTGFQDLNSEVTHNYSAWAVAPGNAFAPILKSGNACNGTYSGATSNVTVTSGQSCVLQGGTVKGNIVVQGGSLTLGSETVSGNVQVQGGRYSIGPAVAIGNDLQIQNTPAVATPNQVCGVSVKGNLQFQSNSGAVNIGSASAPCAGNVIRGNLEVHDNKSGGATALFNNQVGGNLQDNNNVALTQVFRNVVTKTLACAGNAFISGGGNTAAQKQGQCARF
jgi:hypothetical protein